MKASESQQVKCFHEASLCCCAARLAPCQASTAGTGVQIHHYTSSSICSKQSARGTKQLGPLIMRAASFSHHRNASCCAIHILFNLAPKLFRHECKMAVKNNFFSHLHDYFLPPISRLSSRSTRLLIRIWTTLARSQSFAVCTHISPFINQGFPKVRQSAGDGGEKTLQKNKKTKQVCVN